MEKSGGLQIYLEGRVNRYCQGVEGVVGVIEWMVVLFLEEDFSKGEGSRGNLGGYFGKVEVEEFMRVLS